VTESGVPRERILVAHVIHTYALGGMEVGISHLVRNASPDVGHAVVCLSHRSPTHRPLPPGTPVLELRKPPGHSARFVRRVAAALRELRPSVVHTRNWGGMDGIVAARLAGIRAVAHGEHGWGVDDPRGTSRKRILVRRFLQRWVREYTCVSEDIRRWLEAVVRVRRPVARIYNGVDTVAFRPRGEAREGGGGLGIPEDAFVVGSVGRLDPIKNFPAFVEAARRLGARARFVLVGDGPERARLESLAGGAVKFLGEREDVPDLFRAFDLFVLPSLNEGVSNTILEAMASGLPVVATRVGGNVELVEEGRTGTLVPPGDAGALEAAVRRYLDDPALARAQGAAGRARVLERFGIDAMVRGYEAVYRRLAGCGP
jgi:sugar transferase (PEP-CTERM/EpsH1 system associated)